MTQGAVAAGLLAATLVAAAMTVWPWTDDVAGRLGAVGLVGAHRLDKGRDPAAPARWASLARGRTLWAQVGRPPAGVLDRELVLLVEGLAATLRAGLTPARALAHLAAQSGESEELGGLVARLAAQAGAGQRLAPTWRAAGERSGSVALRAVAEGWAMSERHGAPLGEVLDGLVVALRDRARLDAAVATALAAPRATAALLGVLPLGGVVLGELVGVHPIAVLTGTTVGRVAGAAGLAATVGGRLWMRRLVDTAVRG